MAQTTPLAPPTAERRSRMTYDEYRALPEDVLAEWVDGEVIEFVPPKRVHYRLVLFLGRLLAGFADRFGLGEVGLAPFEMLPANVPSARQPDLFFVASNRSGRLTEDRIEGAADLAIEIVSDDSVTRDRQDKFEEYRRSGVRECWILDPRPRRHKAEFYRLTDAGEYEPLPADSEGRVHSTVLPDLWIRPEWFWRDPLPSPDELLNRIFAEMIDPTR